MPLSIGASFWMENPNSKNAAHLWFLITDPSLNRGSGLIVNMTTRKLDSDTSCILSKGEHNSIHHESVIQYAEAFLADVSKIEAAAKYGIVKFDEPISGQLLKKILDGAARSSRLSNEHKILLP